MASIRPHPGGGWRAFINRRGVRESQVFQRKAAAEAWAAKREAEIVAGELELPTKTVADALDRYRLEVAPTHKGARWEEIRLQAMAKNLPFAGKLLAKVDQRDIAAWRDARLQEVSASSVSREWSLLRQVIIRARDEWRWLRDNPMTGVARPDPDDERDRRISWQEVRRVCRALGWRSRPPRTKGQLTALAFLFSLRTAMRSGEILALRWEHIDLKRRVLTAYDTKNGDDRAVPLGRAAARLLGLVSSLPEPFPVKPGTRDALWRDAVKAAGIEDLHFHDARAEATRRLAAKVNVLTLAKITGHRDTRILLNRYYRVDMAEVAKLL